MTQGQSQTIKPLRLQDLIKYKILETLFLAINLDKDLEKKKYVQVVKQLTRLLWPYMPDSLTKRIKDELQVVELKLKDIENSDYSTELKDVKKTEILYDFYDSIMPDLISIIHKNLIPSERIGLLTAENVEEVLKIGEEIKKLKVEFKEIERGVEDEE